MWTRLQQQQQRGQQLHARSGKARQAGEAPAEAVAGREAQEHDFADQDAGVPPNVPPAIYPAGRLQDEEGDNTPSAPDPQVDWDNVVQPETARDDDLPLSEGK